MEIHYPIEVAYELNLIAEKHGTDKGGINTSGTSIHRYTDFYHMLFEGKRKQLKSVLEFGIGSNDVNIPSNMGQDGVPGASLRMWRDFFPNAEVFGLDIDSKTLFQEERIQTEYLNQLNADEISSFLRRNGRTWDLIVDDGLHSEESVLNTIDRAIPFLSPDGYLIVEDVDEALVKKLFSWVQKHMNLQSYVVSFREANGRVCGGYLFVICKAEKVIHMAY